jgi:hypothetical protein
MIGFVDLIFKLLNMAALALLGWYMFRYFFIPQIKVKMEVDSQSLSLLECQKKELFQEQGEVKGQFKQESNEWLLLKQKIVMWNSKLDELKMNADYEYSEQTERLYKYAVEKRDQQSAKKIQSYVLHQAIDKAHQELTIVFTDQEMSQNYLQHIIDNMKKRIQS